MKTTTFSDTLKNLYSPFGNEWVDKNIFVFNAAKDCGLALAGSIGAAVASKKAKKKPGDIDFVTGDVSSSLRFLSHLQDKLLQYSVYWQIQANNRTKFVPENSVSHFRLHAPFWLPICIFVLKDGEFRKWYTKDAYPIQFFGDIKKEAKKMEERDHKPRPIEDELDDSRDDRIRIDIHERDDMFTFGALDEHIQQSPYNCQP